MVNEKKDKVFWSGECKMLTRKDARSYTAETRSFANRIKKKKNPYILNVSVNNKLWRIID